MCDQDKLITELGKFKIEELQSGHRTTIEEEMASLSLICTNKEEQLAHDAVEEALSKLFRILARQYK